MKAALHETYSPQRGTEEHRASMSSVCSVVKGCCQHIPQNEIQRSHGRAATHVVSDYRTTLSNCERLQLPENSDAAQQFPAEGSRPFSDVPRSAAPFPHH